MRGRRRREPKPQLQIHESSIYFDQETEQLRMCPICHLAGDLISPCECRYHQRCLLRYLQGVLQREVRRSRSVELDSLRCERCGCQLHLHYKYRLQYSCGTLLRRLSNECCNKHIVFIAVILLTIIVAAALLVQEHGKVDRSQNERLVVGLVTALAVGGLIFLILLTHFFHKYLSRRQLVLLRVYELIDMRSVGSSSSDDNRIGEECEIIIAPITK